MTSRQYAHDQRLRQLGWKRITVWIDPDMMLCVDTLKRAHGSVQEGVRVAIAAEINRQHDQVED